MLHQVGVSFDLNICLLHLFGFSSLHTLLTIHGHRNLKDKQGYALAQNQGTSRNISGLYLSSLLMFRKG